MIEDLVLVRFPKEAGVYIFSSNDEVIYVGSSKNLNARMKCHRSCIRQGSEHGYKQDLYQYLQANPFTVEFQMTSNYRQLEQELVEKYNPKYNVNRAYTGLGTWNGREAEYKKEWYQKYKEQILGQKKQYYEAHKQQKKQYYEANKEEILGQRKQYYEANKEEVLEQRKQYYEAHKQQKKEYNNQLCCYNNEVLTLATLSKRFRKAGIEHPTIEAKKYLIGDSDD